MNVHNTKKQRRPEKIALEEKKKDLQAMRITKTGFLASKIVCSTVPYSCIHTEKTISDFVGHLMAPKKCRWKRYRLRDSCSPHLHLLSSSHHLPKG